jgi:hypothetical protein
LPGKLGECVKAYVLICYFQECQSEVLELRKIDLKSVGLKRAVNRLEDGIITLSGPALAISGIIAGIDLVTGGNMLRDWPGLTLAWAICLLLTLDFQVLNLGVRAQRLYVSKEKHWAQKYGEIAIILLIASGIAYVSIQMQSIIAIANSASIPVAEAADRLGINLLALTWERSILVLALIFLSGWSRETKTDSSVLSVPQASLDDQTVQLILSKLAKLDQLEQMIVPAQIEVVEQVETPLALPQPEEEQGGTETNEPALEAQIAALLVVNNTLSVREVATIVGRPSTTVHRALKRVEHRRFL